MTSIDPFRTELSQQEVLALLAELIRELVAGANWPNSAVDDYVDAIGSWLASKQTPALDSLERRMIGHILFPAPNFASLADYLTAVGQRVSNPADGWPSHLELPDPDWTVIGRALTAARVYE